MQVNSHVAGTQGPRWESGAGEGLQRRASAPPKGQTSVSRVTRAPHTPGLHEGRVASESVMTTRKA